jgi:Fic family protein
MQNRAGTFKQQLSGAVAYRPFVPAPLQEIRLDDLGDEFLSLLARTSHVVGVLDALSSRIPDIDLFLSMYIRKEALLSSQIEGTQATLDDILDPRAEENQNLHVAEVINYIKAVHFSLDRLKKLPLCMRLLRETHEVLLSGLRGSEKNPGEFRRSQNWIGPGGSAINTAVYVPPAPSDMTKALGDLETYIHDDNDGIAPLIKAALIHYQFETIHPFLDGNGRIGRLLITLFLHEKKILSKPALYISYYLKLNRSEYYSRLTEVRKKGDYSQWIRFFIRAILDTAENAVSTISALMDLRENSRAKIQGLPKGSPGFTKGSPGLGRSGKTALRLYEYIEGSPIINIGKTAADLEISYNTAAKAVRHLLDLGILKAATESRRNQVFAFAGYLDILRPGT